MTNGRGNARCNEGEDVVDRVRERQLCSQFYAWTATDSGKRERENILELIYCIAEVIGDAQVPACLLYITQNFLESWKASFAKATLGLAAIPSPDYLIMKPLEHHFAKSAPVFRVFFFSNQLSFHTIFALFSVQAIPFHFRRQLPLLKLQFLVF